MNAIEAPCGVRTIHRDASFGNLARRRTPVLRPRRKIASTIFWRPAIRKPVRDHLFCPTRNGRGETIQNAATTSNPSTHSWFTENIRPDVAPQEIPSTAGCTSGPRQNKLQHRLQRILNGNEREGTAALTHPWGNYSARKLDTNYFH